MKTFLLKFTVIVIMASALRSAQAGEKPMLPTQDTQAIQKTVTGLFDAWNRNDMKAYASFLTEDCDWINIVGMHWRGRQAVMKAHTAYLSMMFLGVKQQTLESTIDEITPNVALVILTQRMDDFTIPAGKLEKDMHDRMSLVMVKQPDGRWFIRIGHNTTIDPAAAPFDPTK